MTQPNKEVGITLGLTRKSLEGVKIYACRMCGAPGVYKRDEHIKKGWPGCYDPLRHDHPVGGVCPNCGAVRDSDTNLGELSASMPLWLWYMALGFKWCLIKYVTFRRRFANKEKRDASSLYRT